MHKSDSDEKLNQDVNLVEQNSNDFPELESNHEVLEFIGRGGMGQVWKVRDTETNKTFCVKLLLKDGMLDAAALKRFEKEVKAAQSLTHENLVSVYGSGKTTDGSPYMIMDHLEGESLESLLQRKNHLSIEEATEIASQICSGLNYAHSKGIVHSDLKPSNIIICNTDDDGMTVRIVDFGIAKLMPTVNEQTNNMTETGALLGSPSYMSPEQCLGDEQDERSDIYSLGCLFYKMLCGSAPFDNKNPVKIILGHINDKPDFSKLTENKVSKQLISVIEMCLEKEQQSRYRSVDQLAKDLDRVQHGEKPDKSIRTLSEREKRSQNLTRFLGILLIVGSAMCFSYQQYMMDKAEKSVNWPTAQGKVVRNELIRSSLKLRYIYNVKGKEYTNTRFFIGVHTGFEDEDFYIMKNYPVGTETKVYYNPDSPKDSCLEPGLTEQSKSFTYQSSGFLFFFGLVTFALSFCGKKVLGSLEPGREDLADRVAYGPIPFFLAKRTGKTPKEMFFPSLIIQFVLIALIVFVTMILCR